MCRRRRCCSRCSMDVLRVRGRRERDPAMGRAAPCLVPRRGGQRGSDDALSMAHPGDRGCRLFLHAIGLDAYDVDAPGFWGLLALRRSCSRSSWPSRSDCCHRLSTSGCLGGTRRPGPLAPGRPLPVLVCLAGVALVALAKNGLTGLAVGDARMLPRFGCGRAGERRSGIPVFRRRDW